MATRRQRRQTRCRRPVPVDRQPWIHNARIRQRKDESRIVRAFQTLGLPILNVDGCPTADLALGLPYYNREGVRICRNEFLDLFDDAAYRQISLDHHGTHAVISTVWLGIDHAFGMSPHPVIFETMVFGGDEDGFCQRYANEDAARCGHMEVMEALLEGTRP